MKRWKRCGGNTSVGIDNSVDTNEDNRERSMLMERLYRFCNIKQPEIGSYIGNIDDSSERLRLKLEKDPTLK